ncbi:MAG TPA: polyprenol phosphomannose-dependent alpha 1,6 mannosyltransferase MptB, partial [Acidimicrobiales bacterium]|nr:polyprenol phosphomannose-dependent alpha 1,6 mannosyltransferase MptB [Acidimicrobiales bacterium]
MATQPVIPGVDDPVVDQVVTAPPEGTPPVSLRGFAVMGLVASAVIVCGVVLGGTAFMSRLPGAWFFGTPGGPLGSLGPNGSRPSIVAVLAVYGGVGMLAITWVRLLHTLWHRPGVAVRRVVGVVTAWAVPILLAPPLFSRDVYSYAGQGELASHNINPYSYGPEVLGFTSFSTLPDSVWLDSITPYGPTFVGIDGVLDQASGHHILPDILLLRLLEVGGLAMIVAGTPTLARSLKRDPAEAVLMGAGSPLVLVTLIGGAHNDALMLGFLVAGLAVARRVGPVPGVVLCALAAGVKSPAFLGVIFIGWLWAGVGATVWRRVAYAGLASAIGLATLEAVTVATGLSWGWLLAVTTSASSFTGVTPVSFVSRLVSDVAGVVGLHLAVLSLHNVFSVLGLCIAGLIGLRLLWTSPERGLVRNLGLALLVLALLGPVVWAWYVTWGIVVLAPAAAGRLRGAVIAIITYWTVVGAAKITTLSKTLGHAGALQDLVLITSLAAVAIVPLGLYYRRHDRGPALTSNP